MQTALIVENKKISNSFFRLVLRSNENIYEDIKPGQFFRIKTNMFLPRPLSLMDYDGEKFYFLYKKIGRGTSFLSTLKKGNSILITGPHGNGVKKIENRKILLIGGGVGIAPLIAIKNLYNKNSFTTIWGVKEKKDIVEELIDSNTKIAIEEEGVLPTDIIPEQKFSLIFICGPEPMMKSLKEKLSDNTFLIVEGVMGCGVGLCYGCGIKTINGYKRICTDGPVFPAKEVIFDS